MHCIHIVSILYHRWQIRDNLKLLCQQLQGHGCFFVNWNINLQQNKGLKTKGPWVIIYSTGFYIRRNSVILRCKLFFSDPPTAVLYDYRYLPSMYGF
jgi:hypothetical protein